MKTRKILSLIFAVISAFILAFTIGAKISAASGSMSVSIAYQSDTTNGQIRFIGTITGVNDLDDIDSITYSFNNGSKTATKDITKVYTSITDLSGYTAKSNTYYTVFVLTGVNKNVSSSSLTASLTVNADGVDIKSNTVTPDLSVFSSTVTTETISFLEAAGDDETAYAEFSAYPGASSYNAYVSANGSTWTKLDDQLVRYYKGDSSNYYRVDALGLKAGSYYLKVVPVVSGSEVAEGAAKTSALKVTAHDRSGFAWVSDSSYKVSTASGAYNEDGTLISNANVVYITEDTIDTVKLSVQTGSSATTDCTGITEILLAYKKGYETKPLDVRVIGTVDNDGKLTSDSSNFAGDLVIKGSSSDAAKRIKCGITIEGVGEDAVALGWGVRIANASNVEVRNLGFMLTDSDELDCVGLQQNNDHIWVHNCDMFYGTSGGDSDQAKGDGALDCKKSTYITFSYNHFWDNGKCNLLGLSESTTDGLYITYHHNWYDHSDSRHPRVRYYSAHVYNNYYDGNAKYGIGSTLGSSVFAESNYFRNCKYPMLTSMQGSDVFAGTTTRDVTNNATFSKEAGGTIKAFGNIMTGSYTFIAYGADSYSLKGTTTAYDLSGTTSTADFDAVVVANKSDTVSSSITSYSGSNTYNNFDTSSSMYSYTADAAEDVPAKVTAKAGRLNGGDFKFTFNNDVDDASYAVNTELMAKIKAYTSSLISVQGSSDLSSGSTDTTTTYTVTLNANGGTCSTATLSAESGKSVTLPTPTYTGYTFNGWSDGSTTYAAGASYTVTSNKTLTAQWTKNSTSTTTYTVTLNANGGTCSTATLSAESGKSVTLPTPTYTGYTFNGWSDGSTTYAAGASYTVTANKTLTAQWTAVSSGSTDSGDSLAVTSEFASSFTVTGTTTDTANTISAAVSTDNTVTIISKSKVSSISSVDVTMKLSGRKETTITVYYSTDGTTWTSLGTITTSKNDVVETASLTGLSVTSAAYIKIEIKCSKSASSARTVVISSIKVD